MRGTHQNYPFNNNQVNLSAPVGQCREKGGKYENWRICQKCACELWRNPPKLGSEDYWNRKFARKRLGRCYLLYHAAKMPQALCIMDIKNEHGTTDNWFFAEHVYEIVSQPCSGAVYRWNRRKDNPPALFYPASPGHCNAPSSSMMYPWLSLYLVLFFL